jgi:hypothetical protein
MLKGGVRVCDECGETIPKGRKYITIIPKEKVELFRSILAAPTKMPTATVDKKGNLRLVERVTAPGEMMPTTTTDDQGNLRLDICLECHLSSVEPGPTIS